MGRTPRETRFRSSSKIKEKDPPQRHEGHKGWEKEILERYPQARVHGYDGSDEMLRAARNRLAQYEDRFQAQRFDLAAQDWRRPGLPIRAVVSSLAIHHLDGPGKQVLFRDVFGMLEPEGVLVIADIVLPASPAAAALAADAWDVSVRRRSQELDGNTNAFDFFQREQWNLFRYPDDPIDKPSTLLDQLMWLEEAGFSEIDVFWMKAGHAVFGGQKPAAR